MYHLSDIPISILITVSLSFLVAFLFSLRPTYNFSAKSPERTSVSNLPILGAIGFFTQRLTFYRHAQQQSSTGHFSFFLGKNPVVGLSGNEGRKVFFENRGLGFNEGYAVLFGQSPLSLNDQLDANTDKDFANAGGENYFQRRIIRMLKKDQFAKCLPKLISDTKASMAGLGSQGLTDPFESIYRIVFQLTMRIVGCDDIAEDPVLLEKTLQLYQTIEESATAGTILFPWFPSWAMIKRTYAGGRLYMIFKRIVDERKKTGKRGDDPLQFLIDEGDGMTRIIEFVVGALFAGLLNSGVNVAWVLTYLAKSPEWHAKIRAEITAAAAKYAPNQDESLADQLSYLPIEAWEVEFPLLDLCLRDSIRLQLLGTAFRKNVSGGEIPIGKTGQVIPKDAFVTYHIADVHLNPDIYKDPEKWDPSRYLEGREEGKNVEFPFVGWGVARHPCLGMRFAKLEQNIITAYWLAMFDSELVYNDGTPRSEIPETDFEGHSAMKPESRPFLKYQLR